MKQSTIIQELAAIEAKLPYLRMLVVDIRYEHHYTSDSLLTIGKWVCAGCGCINEETEYRCDSCGNDKFMLRECYRPAYTEKQKVAWQEYSQKRLEELARPQEGGLRLLLDKNTHKIKPGAKIRRRNTTYWREKFKKNYATVELVPMGYVSGSVWQVSSINVGPNYITIVIGNKII